MVDDGYLIIYYIEPTESTMLSATWSDQHDDQMLCANLFRDPARIILSLSQVPLPRIASWTLDERGCLALTNRPLLHQFHFLENEDIGTHTPRFLTYNRSDTFYSDLLACHDSHINHQPNSILSPNDGRGQMATLFTMRGLLSHFSRRDLRRGPFVFTLTDLEGASIFVDKHWHIKYIVDLEWACSLPVEMLSPPYWITGRCVDELVGLEHEIFEEAQEELVRIFEEERNFPPIYGSPTYRSDIMKESWKSGQFWYFHALSTYKGCFNLFRQHIPIFHKNVSMSEFVGITYRYWSPKAKRVISKKLKDKAKYDENLKQVFKEGNKFL